MSSQPFGDEGGRRRVLVVDDDSTSRRVLRRLLEADGYDVAIAENGQEALLAIAEHDTDLVLSDVEMPVMNGIRLLEHLATHAPETPVVLMTGTRVHGTAATRAKAVLTKPLDFDELERVVATCAASRH